jgi:hypothetical protein
MPQKPKVRPVPCSHPPLSQSKHTCTSASYGYTSYQTTHPTSYLYSCTRTRARRRRPLRA